VDRWNLIDYVTFFSKDPRFSEIIKNYNYKKSLRGFDIYLRKSDE
jgi:hypothetical protein